MKLRIKYATVGSFAFLSQLDLGRALERNIRRSGFRLSFSKGFNPRPKFAFGPAKPTGFDSFYELIDAEFEDEIDPENFIQNLNEKSPSGLIFLSARTLFDEQFGNIVKESQYADHLLVFKKNLFTKSFLSFISDTIPRFENGFLNEEAYLLEIEEKNKKEDIEGLILTFVNDKIQSKRAIVNLIDLLRGSKKGLYFLAVRTPCSVRRTVRPERLLNSMAFKHFGTTLFDKGVIERIIRLRLLTEDGGELIGLW